MKSNVFASIHNYSIAILIADVTDCHEAQRFHSVSTRLIYLSFSQIAVVLFPDCPRQSLPLPSVASISAALSRPCRWHHPPDAQHATHSTAFGFFCQVYRLTSSGNRFSFWDMTPNTRRPRQPPLHPHLLLLARNCSSQKATQKRCALPKHPIKFMQNTRGKPWTRCCQSLRHRSLER